MSSTLAVIVARAGSKGLPDKCVRPLAGRAVIEYTFDHALSAARVDAVCLTTDSPEAGRLARRRGIVVIDRPPELATDTATVDSAVRHAVERYEARHAGFRAEIIVLLYGNVPIRPPLAIDRAVQLLVASGGDSVRTVAPVTKQHPDWLHRLDGDRMARFRENSIYRRQDLEPLYYHDGAVVVLTRQALYTPPAGPNDHHACFGADRRALRVGPGETVDIDDASDLELAEALLATRPIHPVNLAGRLVGPGHPAFVIAEAGVNHDGQVESALRLIDAARAAGADAVKFQAFTADRLVCASAPACDYQKAHDPAAASQHAMLRRLELPPTAFRRLKQHADGVGIEFLATPFSPEDLRMLLDLGVRALKLASTDLVNVPLLESAAATGLPLIVSTGAAEPHEIDAAVARLHRARAADGLCLLHCVSSYPTPQPDANLRCIAALSRRHRLPVGFSDHTRETETGALAVAAGAVVLEKHFTLDRNAPGPDHFFSLTPSDLADYVRRVRACQAALGDGEFALSTAQLETRRLARGSVVAARPLLPGECLAPDMLRVKRAGRPADSANGGISPADIQQLIGRSVRVAVPGDAVIDWSMLEPAERPPRAPHPTRT